MENKVKKVVQAEGVEQALDTLKFHRMEQGITQKEVAAKMDTTASAVARLESYGGSKKHSPSAKTLGNYAHAVNADVKFLIVKR